jgi:DNA-binding CsgD family transcriptional regulator
MPRRSDLSAAALRRLLEVLEAIYAVRDLDDFAATVPRALQTLVPADTTVLSEVNPRRGRAAWVVDPPDAPVVQYRQAFEHHIREDPVVGWFARSTDRSAVKLSDLVTRQQFHRLAVYNEVYRPGRLEHQIAFALATPHPLMLGITLNRTRRDFSEGDRDGLNLLRPHLVQAYRNAETLSMIQRDLGLLVQGVDELSQALIIVGHDGKIRWQSRRALQWLGEYFAWPRGRGSQRLPAPLHAWLRQTRHRDGSKIVLRPPPPPFAIEREGNRLVATLVGDRTEGLIVLEETRSRAAARDLAPLGLTSREAEVLSWVAQGKTNPEIAQILGLSRRTVDHHLERIYGKLGVETRTAAALRAVEVIQQSPRRSPGD